MTSVRNDYVIPVSCVPDGLILPSAERSTIKRECDRVFVRPFWGESFARL